MSVREGATTVSATTDEQSTVDVVVIGGGPVGVAAATGARAAGMSAAPVAGERVGGECACFGCLPGEVLLRGGQVLRAAHALPEGAGEARLVLDAEHQVVPDATFVGPDVVDLLHAATVAVVAQVTIARPERAATAARRSTAPGPQELP